MLKAYLTSKYWWRNYVSCIRPHPAGYSERGIQKEVDSREGFTNATRHSTTTYLLHDHYVSFKLWSLPETKPCKRRLTSTKIP